VAEERAEATAAQLLLGGADVMQLRAKGWAAERVLGLARRILPLCRAAAVPFFVNAHPRVAADCGADGVHVGQDDGSLAWVRGIVGSEPLVGRSTHSPRQADEALAEGFDCISFGPLFPTPTKLGRPGIGLDGIAGVAAKVGARIPVFCIGGIKPDNLAAVLVAGARRVVIVSALLQAPDVAAATRAARASLIG
jgi:thiamine-phosphate pyrophosphorylase